MAGIVAGYDGSDCAKAALEQAVGLCRTFGEPLVIVFGSAVSQLGGEGGDLIQAVHEVGERRATEAAESARSAGVQVEHVVTDDWPAESLAQAAAERGARMIVVGTHGESPLRGALLGSTPHRLLQISTVPVLVVPVGRS